jgi:uncharacterized membrane protein (UPF0127 family)
MPLVRIGAASLLGAALLSACGGADPETATIRTAGGTAVFEVEVADSAQERARGLAGRDRLAGDAGMLFVFGEPANGRFWMKDTRIPLSVAFLGADGRVLRILDMEPCRAEPCPVYDPRITYTSALEVNRGAFGRAGIGEGDVVEVER